MGIPKSPGFQYIQYTKSWSWLGWLGVPPWLWKPPYIYILWIPRGYHTMVGALPPQGSFPSCFQPITNSSWSAGTQKILRLASISPGMPHLWPQDTSTRFSSHRRFAHESNPSLTLKIAVKHGQDWRPQSVKYGKWLGLTRHNPMVQVLMRRNYWNHNIYTRISIT